jgi:hypothetical protein
MKPLPRNFMTRRMRVSCSALRWVSSEMMASATAHSGASAASAAPDGQRAQLSRQVVQEPADFAGVGGVSA